MTARGLSTFGNMSTSLVLGGTLPRKPKGDILSPQVDQKNETGLLISPPLQNCTEKNFEYRSTDLPFDKMETGAVLKKTIQLKLLCLR